MTDSPRHSWVEETSVPSEWLYDHHFMPLSPPLSEVEYKRLDRQGRINFNTKSGHELVVQFLCLDELVRVIAVTIPRAAAGHEDQFKWMKQIMENALTAIRLSVDPEASPIFTGDGFINLMYQSNDPDPVYEIVIGHTINPDYQLDIRRVLGVFERIARPRLSTIMACLAEGQVPTIPPHYRVLSLVRAIELLYEDKKARSAALDEFQEHFANLGISDRPFRSALPELRTRCAHGRSDGRANPEPFVGIAYNETALAPLQILLRSVVAHGVQTQFGMELGGMQFLPSGHANALATTGQGEGL